MIIAVAGCVAQAEGAEILRRAPLCRRRARPPGLSPPARDGGQGRARGRRPARHGFSHRIEIRPFARGPWRSRGQRLPRRCRRVATSSAASASCLIPAGPKPRAPWPRCWPRPRRWSESGAAEITLLGQNVNAYHGEGPAGENWTLARLIRRLARIEGLKRIRYTTSHPADMDERSHRRPWRGGKADALPASAGPVGLRFRARRHEPASWGRRLSRRGRAAARGARRHRALLGFHRRVPGRKRGRLRRHPGVGRTRSVSPRPSPSNTAPAQARPPRRSKTNCPRR